MKFSKDNLLYKHEICFDCTNKARNYLNICQNDAWNLGLKNFKGSKIIGVLLNLIFEYANPRYFHIINCENYKNLK